MIDIHTHILPGVDDGAQDLADSLLMAEMAVESGVSGIIATPHCNIPGEDDTGRKEMLWNCYAEFRQELMDRGIPLELYMGMEIYLQGDFISKIKAGELLSLNGSGHYLVEFPFQETGKKADRLICSLVDAGISPVIAHAERFACVQEHPSLAMEWKEMGCQIQINKNSLYGSFGRRAGSTAMKLLGADCVTYVASDAHSPYSRNTYMADVYEFLAEEFSFETAELLLKENPRRYLSYKE